VYIRTLPGSNGTKTSFSRVKVLKKRILDEDAVITISIKESSEIIKRYIPEKTIVKKATKNNKKNQITPTHTTP